MVFSNLQTKARKVVRVYRIFFREALGLFGWKLLWPVLAGFFGIFLQIGSIGIIFLYAKYLIQDDPLTLFSTTYQPRESMQLLVLIAAACLVFLTLSAWGTYYYFSRAVRMSCLFEKHCMYRLFTWVGSGVPLQLPKSEATAESTLIKMSMNDTRACGRAFLMVFTALIPFLTFLVSSVVLFQLHWQLTLLLTAVLLLFLGALYHVNLFGVKSSRDLEVFATQVRDSNRELVQSLRSSTLEFDLDKRWASPGNQKKLEGYLSSYGGLIGLSYRSAVVGDLFLALTLTMVFFGLSSTAIQDQFPWTAISAYLVALQYSIRHLKQTLTRGTLCNRFFPQLSRFFSLAGSREEEGLAPRPLAVRTGGDSPFPGGAAQLEPGKPAFLYFPRSIHRFNFQDLSPVLHSEEGKAPRYKVVQSLEPGKHSGMLDLLRESPLRRELREQVALGRGAWMDLARLLPEGKEAILKGQDLGSLSFFLSLFSALRDSPPWILLGAGDLDRLGEGDWPQVLDRWKGSMILVCRQDLSLPKYSSFPIHADSPVVVASAKPELLWAGSQSDFKNYRKELVPHYKQEGEGEKSSQVDVELDLAEI